jgi:hypothetical protein
VLNSLFVYLKNVVDDIHPWPVEVAVHDGQVRGFQLKKSMQMWDNRKWGKAGRMALELGSMVHCRCRTGSVP